MSDTPQMTLYWRPACGFCSALRHQLDSAGITYEQINIWDEPAAAQVVRAYAGGNETVPTVVLGEPLGIDAVGLVNPSVTQVLAELERRG